MLHLTTIISHMPRLLQWYPGFLDRALEKEQTTARARRRPILVQRPASNGVQHHFSPHRFPTRPGWCCERCNNTTVTGPSQVVP